MCGMNKLSRETRAQILGLMVEGMSLRAISRMTGASKNTIVKLMEDAGEAFSDYQDHTLRGLTCKRVQVDEIWAFVYAKAKNVKAAKAAPEGAGDCWTWLAMTASRYSNGPSFSRSSPRVSTSSSRCVWPASRIK